MVVITAITARSVLRYSHGRARSLRYRPMYDGDDVRRSIDAPHNDDDVVAQSHLTYTVTSLVDTDATGVEVVQVKTVLGGAHTTHFHLDAVHPGLSLAQPVPHLHLVRQLGAAKRTFLLAAAARLHAEHSMYLLRHPVGVLVNADPVVTHGRVLAFSQVHVVDVPADSDTTTLLVVRMIHDLRLVTEAVAADRVTDVAVSHSVRRRALRQQRVQQDQQDEYPLVQEDRTEDIPEY